MTMLYVIWAHVMIFSRRSSFRALKKVDGLCSKLWHLKDKDVT
jgi:hypothetical protein